MQLTTGAEPVTVRWFAVAETAGIVTVRAGDALATLSVLATGRVPDADEITIHTFQKRLTKELHDTGYEPGFALLSLTQRPLLATVTCHDPQDETARIVVALADRCFAASYFRFHSLA